MPNPTPNRPAFPQCRPVPRPVLASSDRYEQPGRRRPERRAALPTADALVVTAFRMRAQGPERWALAVEGFRHILGEDAATYALHGIRCLLEILDGAARRPFDLNPPGHPVITPGERAVLTALAALQRGRRGHAEAVLSWLLPAAARAEAAKHAFWIAEGLKGRRLFLSLPET